MDYKLFWCFYPPWALKWSWFALSIVSGLNFSVSTQHGITLIFSPKPSKPFQLKISFFPFEVKEITCSEFLKNWISFLLKYQLFYIFIKNLLNWLKILDFKGFSTLFSKRFLKRVQRYISHLLSASFFPKKVKFSFIKSDIFLQIFNSTNLALVKTALTSTNFNIFRD